MKKKKILKVLAVTISLCAVFSITTYAANDCKESTNVKAIVVDNDFDGIEDSVDMDPTSNNFTGNFADPSISMDYDIDINVDYRAFFEDNTKYNKDLSKLAAIYSNAAYPGHILTVDTGTNFSGEREVVFKNFGLNDVQIYHIADSEEWKANPDDDVSEIVIGHRNVVYNNEEKEVIVVAVRGSNTTIQEWTSNFDVGANTENYWDVNNPDWTNKLNHKGVDVPANRLYKYIINYVNTKLSDTDSKSILLTGHSRGAAIANILGTKFEDDSNFDSYTYTFAPMNTTTDENASRYKTIFNIVNKDDITPTIPSAKWGFRKYGTTLETSIKDSYVESLFFKKGTWCEMYDCSYNSNEAYRGLVKNLGNIVKSREELYEFSDDPDTVYTYKSNDYRDGDLEVANRIKKYGERFNRHVKVTAESKGKKLIFGEGFKEVFDVKVQQTPGFFLTVIGDLVASKEYVPVDGETQLAPFTQQGIGEDNIVVMTTSFYVAKKYKSAKNSFIHSGADSNSIAAKLHIGGMTHPHLIGSYYLLSSDPANKLVVE